MRKLLFVLLAVLIACSPPQPVTTPAPEQHETVVETQEEVTQPPQPAPETEPEAVPSEPELAIDPYTELGCEQLLTSEQFAAECGKTSDDYIVTYKVGTRNCFVNVKDKENERLTAGITLTGYADGSAATKEFDRRLVVMRVGADKSVGERAYTLTKVDRETVNFLREEFLVEVGADMRLCGKESITNLAKAVDSHLN